jgi:hypothetical protein
MTTPHQWKKYRNIQWLVCKCCGLVYLRNALTERAVREGCEK